MLWDVTVRNGFLSAAGEGCARERQRGSGGAGEDLVASGRNDDNHISCALYRRNVGFGHER